MRVNDMGPDGCDDSANAIGCQAHLSDKAIAWLAGRSEKCHPVNVFVQGICGALLGGGQVEGLPAQPALLAQDGKRPERIATMQRNRVIQDVKDAQGHAATGDCASLLVGTLEPISTTLRRNASNINSVHKGEL